MGSSKEKYQLAKVEQRPDSKSLQVGGRTTKVPIQHLAGSPYMRGYPEVKHLGTVKPSYLCVTDESQSNKH